MGDFKNAMEVFKLLDKSNCKKCLYPTCLAFAGAVYTGRARLSDCPSLSREICDRFGDRMTAPPPSERRIEELLASLRRKIQSIDLKEQSNLLGGEYLDDRLVLKILGKRFAIDATGACFTDIHVNPWIAVPVYRYILKGAKREPSGQWVPFRELPGGREGAGLFERRCEQPIKRLADTFTDLFDDMVHLFSGRQVENIFDSDISIVLTPLPKIPMMICYWRPDGEMPSDVHLFFDANAEDNLDVESLNSMATGFVRMLEKIALRHT